MSAVLCNRYITFFGKELSLHFMTQENKRSFHCNCITSNRDSSCNETSDIRPLGRLSFPSDVAHIKLVNHWKRTGRRPVARYGECAILVHLHRPRPGDPRQAAQRLVHRRLDFHGLGSRWRGLNCLISGAAKSDIIGLYLKPRPMPQCSAWMKRAPSRLSIASIRFCRFRPGRAERHGFGISVMAPSRCMPPSRTRSGQVIGGPAPPHPRGVRGLSRRVVTTQPYGKEIHVVVDHLSAHKNQARGALPCRPSQRSLHYTPPIVPGSIRSKSGSPKSSAT